MIIDEKAKIPLFSALACLPIIIGFIVWLTAIDSRATAAQEELRGVRTLLLDARERLIRIEEKVK